MSFSITVAAQTTEFPTVEYQTDKDAVISKVRIMSTSTIVSVRVQGHGKGSWIEISPYTYLCFLYALILFGSENNFINKNMKYNEVVQKLKDIVYR